MSVKKQTTEEKLSQSIFYNLSILKLAMKTTTDFDEHLSNTMFLKSNTKAFIHITHFLFNILDQKEFKAKFYWPIVEKKAENAYRSASIDLINSLIDKHNIAHEKVKLVFVVHPCGKKFMSLILELVVLAMKEIMKRRKMKFGRSVDIDKVTEICTNMKQIETNLVTNIQNETKEIKEKTQAIQELINVKIFPANEFPGSFNEFIETWHESNKNQLTDIELRNDEMESIYQQTAELHARAQQMLKPKNYKMFAPPLAAIKEVADFYQNAGVTNETIPNPIKADELNFSWLIAQLHLVLPAIINYVSNCTLDPLDSSNEELKVLSRLALELSKIESKTDEFSSNFKKVIPEVIATLKLSKLERKHQEEGNQTHEELSERAAKDEMENEQLKLLSSPRFFFDTSAECLKHVVIKKTRLSLMNDDEGKENLANETKFYRSSKSPFVNRQLKLNQTVVNGMIAPRQQPRRRLDPMELLERATSNKSRQGLNSTSRYLSTGAIPKQSCQLSPKFSSTMLSPELRQPFFNCSTVSEIMKASPVVEISENLFESAFQQTMNVKTNFNMDCFQVQSNSSDALQNPWNDPAVMKSIEMSPRGKLKALVLAEEIFKNPPKTELNEKTITESMSSSENEKTVINQYSNTSAEVGSCDSFSFGSIMLPTDENLFNISDSILKDVEN